MSVGRRLEMFNIVSNNHGRTQKCDFCVSVCKAKITDHHTPARRHGLTDSVLVCKMHDCYCTIRNNFERFHSLLSTDASDCNYQTSYLYESKPLQNAFESTQYYIYLFKLYSTSIILVLKNNLTSICSKISKIEMNL